MEIARVVAAAAEPGSGAGVGRSMNSIEQRFRSADGADGALWMGSSAMRHPALRLPARAWHAIALGLMLVSLAVAAAVAIGHA